MDRDEFFKVMVATGVITDCVYCRNGYCAKYNIECNPNEVECDDKQEQYYVLV